MEKFNFEAINKNEFKISYKNNYKKYNLVDFFNDVPVSSRVLYKILKDFGFDVSLGFLHKLISSKLFEGLNEILLDEYKEEDKTFNSIKFCLNFINLVILNISLNFDNLTSDIVEDFNASLK